MRTRRHQEMRREQPQKPSIEGALGMVAVLLAVVAALSFPLVATGVLAGGVTVLLASKYVSPAIAARLRDRTRRVAVPGLGTIEYRLVRR